LETKEAVAFNIAAQVVDMRPNGNIVLEARKHIRVNHEVWEIFVSGTCRQEDISPDNVVLRRNVVICASTRTNEAMCAMPTAGAG